jgi:hypothetical protein
MSRFAALVLAAFVLSLSAAPLAAASQVATARKLLTKCEAAVNSVPIVALAANTPQVPKANRRAQAAFSKCGTDAPWLKLNPYKKGPVHDAYYAWWDLALGIGDYMTYCHNIAFEHTGESILHKAQHEIKHGRKEAKHALAEL